MFFHSITKARRIRNRIISIKDAHVNIFQGVIEIARVAEEYFQTQFSSQHHRNGELEEVFRGFGNRVSQEINEDLTKPITDEEIHKAMFSIGAGAHKAPGPDGFAASFYHTFWNEINSTVIKEFRQFFDGDFQEQEHNQTNIWLIPKVVPAITMTEFRTIAPCNVSYKVI